MNVTLRRLKEAMGNSLVQRAGKGLARKVWNVSDAPILAEHGRDEPFRADQNEMETKKPSDPFDGRPCNKLLQGIPGAEHA